MNLRLHRLSMDCPWRVENRARPAGLEPATPGLEGRRYEPARDGPRRSRLLLRPVSRVGGNCFPPQTVTACHTCVTPQPFEPATSADRLFGARDV